MIKTLIDSFQYPRLGPGQMWEAAATGPRSRGARCTSTAASSGSSTTARPSPPSSPATPRAGLTRYHGRAFHLDPADPRPDPRPEPAPLPPRSSQAAESLKYRDFLTVVLIVDRAETFPDNWIYIHEPEVRLGRVQNFKNWSPDLVPDPASSSLGLEYFCFEGDDLWTRSDADLVALGRREIDAIGLVDAARRHRRLRRPDAQGVPGLRRRLPGPPGRDPRLARASCRTSSWPGATACTSTTTRTTR